MSEMVGIGNGEGVEGGGGGGGGGRRNENSEHSELWRRVDW